MHPTLIPASKVVLDLYTPEGWKAELTQVTRQFCTPDITLAAHSLLDTVQDRATHAQCTRWPVSGIHQGHRGFVAPVASNPGREVSGKSA